MNLSHRHPFIRAADTANMWTLLNAMIDFGLLHRMPVVDDKNIVGLLAQSDVVSWIQGFLESDPIGNKAIRDTSMGEQKEVIQIHKDQTMKEAFTKIKESKISGIAVVSEFDSLYGNVSASDVKMVGMKSDIFMKLNQTVEEFLTNIPPNPAFGLNPVFIRPSDSVKILARKFVDSGVHRIYLVGEMMKLIGVISLIDFIIFLVGEARQKKE